MHRVILKYKGLGAEARVQNCAVDKVIPYYLNDSCICNENMNPISFMYFTFH